MAINRAQTKKQLQEGLNAVFGLEYKQYPELWKDIFTMSKEGKKAYVEDVLMSGFGAAPVKAEGAGVLYDSASEGYVSRYVFETVALAFALTEEAEEDNLYGDLGSRLSKSLARSFQYTKNVKGANILNNMFTAGFTGGDGVVLGSASHPLQGGGTASNILSTAADLSETSLEDMLIQIGDAVDDRSLPVHLMVKKLVVPTELQFTAQRLLKSDGRVGTADNDLNAIKSMSLVGGGWCSNVYLTDPDAWFLTTDCPDGLKYIERKAISGGVEGDFESGNMRFKKRERYVFGFSDWRGVYGTPGA
jgi:hypothetical protein